MQKLLKHTEIFLLGTYRYILDSLNNILIICSLYVILMYKVYYCLDSFKSILSFFVQVCKDPHIITKGDVNCWNNKWNYNKQYLGKRRNDSIREKISQNHKFKNRSYLANVPDIIWLDNIRAMVSHKYQDCFLDVKKLSIFQVNTTIAPSIAFVNRQDTYVL